LLPSIGNPEVICDGVIRNGSVQKRVDIISERCDLYVPLRVIQMMADGVSRVGFQEAEEQQGLL